MPNSFTLGPWHTRHGQSYTAIYAGEKVVGYIDHFNEHDKRLLMAAPDLFEALQDALGDLEYLKSAPDSAYARPDDETILSARAAIAKAGGES